MSSMPPPIATAGRGTRGRAGTAWQSVIVTQSAGREPGCQFVVGPACDWPSGRLRSMIDGSRGDDSSRSAGRGFGSPDFADCVHRLQTALAGDHPPPPASSRQPAGSNLDADPRKAVADHVSHALHDPTIERDACGIGLVADARGRASRALVDRALAGLAAFSHRGAWAADGVTGDGAGLLLPLQQSLTGIEGAGLAMCLMREPWLRGIVEEACRSEGLEPFGWRDVPTDVAALGSTATASMPRIA